MHHHACPVHLVLQTGPRASRIQEVLSLLTKSQPWSLVLVHKSSVDLCVLKFSDVS